MMPQLTGTTMLGPQFLLQQNPFGHLEQQMHHQQQQQQQQQQHLANQKQLPMPPSPPRIYE